MNYAESRELSDKSGWHFTIRNDAPHPSREEADECYHQWRLRKIEETIEFTDELLGDWAGCEICDAPTKGGARYRDDHYPEHVALCPEHRTKELVLGRVQRVTRSMYS